MSTPARWSASAVVATDEIITAAAAYTTPIGTYVAFKGAGASCPGDAGDLTAIRIGAAAPPTITTAWCATQHGLGSLMVTTLDGHAGAIVWSATGSMASTGRRVKRSLRAAAPETLWDRSSAARRRLRRRAASSSPGRRRSTRSRPGSRLRLRRPLRLRWAAGTRDTPVYFQYVKPPQQHQGESLEPTATCRYDLTHAKVAELADAQDSGSCGLNTRGGSSHPFRIFSPLEDQALAAIVSGDPSLRTQFEGVRRSQTPRDACGIHAA